MDKLFYRRVSGFVLISGTKCLKFDIYCINLRYLLDCV